ncbi:MAG TPA: AbrB/MazE/SpoVT family DNA-binding domain-containing protein [Gemmatimonadaceae bacterium]|nr:AbrB/MazE/SpoVT family DNA-binding domain-containing protein [Gemmatimonadaceae bacterium]
MTTTVQRWGNSLAIRIPKAYALEAGLEEDTEVEIGVRAGNLFVRPARKEWNLDSLLAGVTSSNLHREMDWNDPAGREVW